MFLLAVGPVIYLLRRRSDDTDRVSLHYDDGSAVTLERGAPGFDRLLALGRDALTGLSG